MPKMQDDRGVTHAYPLSLGPSPASGMRFKHVVWFWRGHSGQHSMKMTANEEIPTPQDVVSFLENEVPLITISPPELEVAAQGPR